MCIVSAWMHCLGLPGSATRQESSWIMPSSPMASRKKGAILRVSSSIAARTSGADSGRNMSWRFPKTPFIPRQLTPPNRSSKGTRPAVTSALARSLSSLMNLSSSSAVAADSAPVTQVHPSVSSTLLATSGLALTTSVGKLRIDCTPPVLRPTSSFPSLRASISALAAASFSITLPSAAAVGCKTARRPLRRWPASDAAAVGRLRARCASPTRSGMERTGAAMYAMMPGVYRAGCLRSLW
mmetsp:Transcript_19594/g.51091  ORF Transcript_19594/g.51091 Transcript_19594/m.51091 type:complete len:240 (+) Transcript_19594:515-1234(+)